MPLSITNTTKEKLPEHPYKKITERVLGSAYNLSLTIVDEQKIQELNKNYRAVNSPTDILSFPLSADSGEIFLCLSQAKKEASKFERTYENFVGFLLIHGLMHLKGFDHSSEMEKLESFYCTQFKLDN